MDPKLTKKLHALGMHLGPRNLKRKGNEDFNSDIFQEATYYENIYGKSLFLDRRYSPDYSHGRITFDFLKQKLFNLSEHSGVELHQTLFIDTETTGLSQSAGTFAFMVGLGFWENENFIVRQFFLQQPGEEAAMLLQLSNELDRFNFIVSYNGIGFDIPILNSRRKIYQLPLNFEKKYHIDLLKHARKLWRYQFENRSLKSIEQKVLEYQRNSDEIPGWMIPDMYRDFIKSGNVNPMKGVLYHNEMDIVSLAALFSVLDKIYNDHSQFTDDYETIGFALAKSYERSRQFQRAEELYDKTLRQTNLPKSLKVETILKNALLNKKLGKIEKSIDLWEKAIKLGSVEACVELAKYYEHAAKDLEKASSVVKLAFKFNLQETNPVKKKTMENNLIHRSERLEQKISRKGKEQ